MTMTVAGGDRETGIVRPRPCPDCVRDIHARLATIRAGIYGFLIPPRTGGGFAIKEGRAAPMLMAATTIVGLLATLVFSLSSVQAADISAGSGVVIGTHGEILTNSHVVEDCAKITVQFKDSEIAGMVTRDQKNDLAVVRTGKPLRSVAAFRDGARVRAGDAVVVLGYPLSGLLASTANLSVGHVSALAGLGDDSRYLQISAPVQPGNSGGPLLIQVGT